MGFIFEDLEVYQRAVDLAEAVLETMDRAPRGSGALKDQLNRAALSIPTNLAEGNGRSTPADRIRFFVIARGSMQECVPLLELSRRRGIVTTHEFESLTGQLASVARMTNGLIRWQKR